MKTTISILLTSLFLAGSVNSFARIHKTNSCKASTHKTAKGVVKSKQNCPNRPGCICH